MKKLVLCSGGIDSVAALYLAARQCQDVGLLFIDYGQVNIQAERRAFNEISQAFSHTYPDSYLETLYIDLSSWGSALLTSALTNDYAYDMVVPGRNLVLASVAASLAEDRTYEGIVLGVIGGDNDFPDCQPDIWAGFEGLLRASLDNEKFTIWCPYIHKSKKYVIHKAASWSVPLELTWSCYERGVYPAHCGECYACKARKKAFQEAEVQDPTEYINE